jgi:hypothetical protein
MITEEAAEAAAGTEAEGTAEAAEEEAGNLFNK